MDALNTDCLIQIFSLLDFKQKVRCERVCRRWRAVLRTPHCYSDMKTLHVTEFLKNSDANYFQQENLNFIPTVCGVISRCGPHVRELSFDAGWFRLSPPIIDAISQNCGQLERLDLSCTLLSGDLSAVLERVAAKLVYFSLDECNLVAEENADKISRFFGRMTRLSEINLRKCRVNMEHILDLPKQLTSIDLSGIHHMTPELITYFLVGHSALESLTLSPFPARLPVHDPADPSNGLSVVFECIGALPRLRHLSVGHLMHDPQALPLAPLAQLRSLRSLELRDCLCVNAHVLKQIVSNAQQLESLTLVNCAKMCDYRLLAHCPQLRELVVERTFQICDEDLEEVSRHRRLERLVLRRCPNVTNKTVQTATAACPLKELDFSFCDVDDGLFVILAASELKLRKLMLDGCKGVTSAGIATLTTEGKHLLRSLHELDLSHNKMITNECILALSKRVDKIKRIKRPLVIYASQTSVQAEVARELSKRVELSV
ncbi:F-box domain-containing protein [Aphelenchoides fujianensis]|nr:F-box domain-containing protein [Aphelenchoides fujianensis]